MFERSKRTFDSGRGLAEPRFAHPERNESPNACILCGLCVRVCRDLVGAAAIGFIGRGTGREVGAPFHVQSEACIGCGACAAVCPTGAVRYDAVRRVENPPNVKIAFPAATAVRPSVTYTLEVVQVYPTLPDLARNPLYDGFRRDFLKPGQDRSSFAVEVGPLTPQSRHELAPLSGIGHLKPVREG